MRQWRTPYTDRDYLPWKVHLLLALKSASPRGEKSLTQAAQRLAGPVIFMPWLHQNTLGASWNFLRHWETKSEQAVYDRVATTASRQNYLFTRSLRMLRLCATSAEKFYNWPIRRLVKTELMRLLSLTLFIVTNNLKNFRRPKHIYQLYIGSICKLNNWWNWRLYRVWQSA